MTEFITYEHSAAVTMSLPVILNSLQIEGIIEGIQVTGRANKGTSIVNDPNRVRRRISFNCLLSRANTVTMEGYMQPAAALAYTTYPRFSTWYRDAGTTETNVKVVRTAFSHRPYGMVGATFMYLWTLTFEERF
jgi:hypothetical protein